MKASLDIFSDNLKQLMQRQGITDYSQLADELEVEPHRVKRWLDAKCFPKHDMMVKLLNYFGYTDYNGILTQPISMNAR